MKKLYVILLVGITFSCASKPIEQRSNLVDCGTLCSSGLVKSFKEGMLQCNCRDMFTEVQNDETATK